MKKILLAFTAISMMAMIACKKTTHDTQPAPDPVPIPSPIVDTAKVLLKDMLSTNLPSPYYHFEYDNSKFVSRITFASRMFIYDTRYENNRLKEMTNINNSNQLLYSYTNGSVSQITESSGFTSEKLWKYHFTYSANKQLMGIKWIRFSNNGNDSILYRKVQFDYHPDGNLSEMDDYRGDTTGQLQWSTHREYKDYDNKINVHDFALFKDFFESFLFLPSVKLQKNNPGTEITTGVNNDYKITYTYQYNDKLPLVQTGRMVQTRGTGTGQIFNFSNRFSYY